MTLASLATALAGIGAAVMAVLALLFWRDPAQAMRLTTHRAEALPQVMVDRYAAFGVLAVGAALSGDPVVIAWLFSAFALMGFADAWIYARAGYAFAKHLAAGVAALVVVAVALAGRAGEGNL
ncbi:hypothetical protein [Roseovarius salinarum]|uniref:hypothetical protein n=1 Tax=Roseovarius salinarum TaxID=1981892 RepID=UPI000C340AEF|nr:hypothetical protein [Roseovarius salinarum]